MWGGSYNPTLFNTHTSMFLSTATKHSTFTTQHPFEYMKLEMKSLKKKFKKKYIYIYEVIHSSIPHTSHHWERGLQSNPYFLQSSCHILCSNASIFVEFCSRPKTIVSLFCTYIF